MENQPLFHTHCGNVKAWKTGINSFNKSVLNQCIELMILARLNKM